MAPNLKHKAFLFTDNVLRNLLNTSLWVN